ncbi:MAG: hypothetical protein HOP36_11555 [Methyloglobulus sp.]|nr:hypothetical protein [Methyloglobulus sp.]
MGFGQRALLEGWRAVSNNRTDYSGHRLLADSYSALPSHELARTSELLQSQLLQPNNITPIQPHLGERNLAILPGSGPTGAGFNEFNPLFSKNGFSLQTSGVIGSLDTYGDEVVHSGIWDKFSYSLGQFHHQTNGFRPNNKIDQNIYNAFIQGSPSEGLNIQAEYRHRDVTHGDLFYYGDLSQFSPKLTRHVNTDTYRIGMTINPTTNSNILTSVTFLDHSDNVLNIVEGFNQYQKTQRGTLGEVQYNFKSDIYSLSMGGGGYAVDNGTLFKFGSFSLPRNFNTNYENFYLYNFINYPKDVTVTLGLSLDSIHNALVGSYNRTQINPKFGLLWQMDKSTTLRFAALRTLSRGLWVDSTIEPIQVAGFNQFFDSWPVTGAWRYGVGIDHKFSKSILVGAEVSKRDVVQPITNLPEFTVFLDKWEEKFLRGYFYWAINDYLAANLEYQYDAVSNGGFSWYKNHIIPFSLRFFDHEYGFNASATITYVNQNALSPSSYTASDSSFGLLDLAMSYRLPNRLGVIKMQLKNALDKKFNFVGQNIAGQRSDRFEETPLFVPDRTFFVNFTLSF